MHKVKQMAREARAADGGGSESVVAELRDSIKTLERNQSVYNKYIKDRMLDGFKLKAKLLGFPKDWKTAEQVRESEDLKPLLTNCTDIDLWIKKNGDEVGVAIVTYRAVADRQNDVKTLKQQKIKINGFNVFLNNLKTEYDEEHDKPILTALKEAREVWAGELSEVKPNWKPEAERGIKIGSRLVAIQNEDTWEINWKIPNN